MRELLESSEFLYITQSTTTPRLAKQSARQAWQPSTQRKRRKTSKAVDSGTAKQLKQTRTDDELESESTGSRQRFLAPVMEESEEDTLIPESPSPSIASLLPPAEFQAHSKIPTAKAKKISRPTAEEDSDAAKIAKTATPPKRRKALVGRVADDTSSSDHETHSDENKSPTHSSHAEDLDGGETMDLDEDTDLNGQDPHHLRDIFTAERPTWSSPKGPGSLFDNDDNISIEPRKNQSGRKDYSALFAESDSDNKQTPTGSGPNQAHGSPPEGQHEITPKPAKSRRQKAYDFEKPHWEESADKTPSKQPPKQHIKIERAHKDTIPSAQSQWPPEACIIHPLSGDIKLMDQHHKLAEVIRESFKVITKKTLFENAFPSIESRPKLARHCLYMAAKSKNANAIKERVKEDENFARNLQDLVVARAGTLRTNAKDSAVKAVPAGYNLNGSDRKKIANRVEEWLKDDKYIFPLRDGAKKLDFDNPFHHPVIVSILREEFFQKANSFGRAHSKLFVSSHKRRPEPELPGPMVALMATAIYCALREWHTGQRQNAAFSQATFEDTYQGHINTLGELQTRRPNQYHRDVLLLIQIPSNSHVRLSAASSSALKMMCLDEVDDED
ncbi:hypothetical protein F5888DRAFT_1637348 [Russula emetica]|nr:hypothetical protein F5888DRAFT_1637348 [Russula emetica]